MSSFNFKTTLGQGIALAIPIAIVAYVFIRIIGIFEKMIGPLAQKMGIAHIWGSITLTILAIILIIIVILVLGFLMQIAFVSAISKQLEAIILKFVPSLNQLKLMAVNKLDLENAQTNWKPVVIYFEARYNAAFVIEEDEELVTLFVCKTASLHDGEIMVVRREEVRILPATYDMLHKSNRAFGMGYIQWIKENEMTVGNS